MKTPLVFSIGIFLSLACSGAIADQGSDPTEIRITPRILSVEKVLASGKENTEDGKELIREAVCKGLMVKDYWERLDFLRFLEDNTRWINASAYEDCFQESAEKYGGEYNYLLDKTELLHAPHKLRVEILRSCIQQGSYKLWRGSVRLRLSCIGMATREGEESLIPLVRDYYSQLGEQSRSLFPWPVAEANFELYQGSLGGEDGLTVAVDRIEAMSTDALHERLVADPGFKQAFSSLTVAVCDEGWDPKCGQLVKVIDQVTAFHKDYLARSKPKDTGATEPFWSDEVGAALREFYEYKQLVKNGFFE